MAFNKRSLIGHRIVDVKRNAWRSRPQIPGDRDVAHNCTLILDNGTTIGFVVEETETGEYGVDLCVWKPAKPARKT